MKKIILVILIVASMLCVSISGAGFTLNKNNPHTTSTETPYYIPTEQAVQKLANVANQYLSLSEDHFTPKEKTKTTLELPNVGALKTSLFEWVIVVEYNGVEQEQKIDIEPSEFDEFLKKPLYMREYFFKVDDDNDPYDVQVKIGFSKSTVLNMRDYEESMGLTTKTIIRTWFPDDSGGGYGLNDDEGELEVWSEIRINYGIFKDTGKGKGRSIDSFPILSRIQEKFKNFKIITNLLEKIGSTFIPKILSNFWNKISEDATIDSQKNCLTTSQNDDNDWVSVGMGYASPNGKEIPAVVEKRFTFAKDKIFSPTILEQEMFPGGDDPYQLKFRFRSYTAGTTDPANAVYDIGFGAEFEPAFNIRTQYIPIGGYVYYHFDTTSRSYTSSKITYLVDITKGSGEDLPLLTLEFDNIDSSIGNSGNWVSFDLNLNGFEYKANKRFDVGINVGVPELFSEKVQIKGLPTSVKFEWGVSNTDLTFVPPNKEFGVGLDVYADLVMDGRIDKIIVYYPRTQTYPDDAPDAPFLVVNSIPSTNRFSAGGSIDVKNYNLLNVGVTGNIGLSSSGNSGSINVYFPKSDWSDPIDLPFITVPDGIPARVQGSAAITLNVDTKNLMNPSNYIYGMVDHDCSGDISEIKVFVPFFEDPLLRFTEIPADVHTYGKLWWGQLMGEFYSNRRSQQNRDPVEINLEWGSFSLYNRLAIRDGTILLRFKLAESGYFYFDTTERMVANDLRYNNYDSGDQLLLYVDDVSAEQLQADWSLDTSGEQIKINSLRFGGVLKTLKDLSLTLAYKGKSATASLDWVIGETGNFEISLEQDDDLTLNFDELFPENEGYRLDGGITISNTLECDMEWKLDLGSGADDTGFFKINQNSNPNNIKELDLYFTLLDAQGEEAYGIDAYFKNPTVRLEIRWYFDIDDIWPPYIHIWPVINFQATVKDVKILWTDLWPGSDDYGEHHWIDVI